MNYATKKQIADKYLLSLADVTWDELADINSLHEAETESDIIDLCDERLEEAGFPG